MKNSPAERLVRFGLLDVLAESGRVQSWIEVFMIKQHPCKRCGQWHDLFYRVCLNGSEHLMYICTKTNQVFTLPFIGGLEIPRRLSKKILKRENERKQTELL